jgi:DNA-binding NtrC family response regulator
MTKARILVADDQADICTALRLLLRGAGWETTCVSSPAAVLSALEAEDFDLAVLDLNYTRDTTSGQEGLDLLGRIVQLDPTLPVLVMTAWGTVEGAVEAMRRGARDYVQKPWDNQRLLSTVETQLALGRALRESRRLRDENRRLCCCEAPPALVAESAAMGQLQRVLERVAPSSANVLVTGEHGTGKDVVARWLHFKSDRCEQPLVTLNMGAMAEGTSESELFGHVRGAFTDAKADRLGCFELAHGGTLFLDEIGNMPPAQQAKLLRVIETGELQRVGSSKVHRVDVRLVSATNTDLEAAVQAGSFREDLLYRLNTVELRVPPLRERREDVAPLAQAFLLELSTKYRRPGLSFSSEASAALLSHSWPGNVRELRHAVERAVLMASGDQVTADDLVLRRRRCDATAAAPAPGVEELSLEQMERLMIERALARHEGNVAEAAKQLGLSRSALYRRLQRLGLGGGEDGGEGEE